MDGSGAVAEPDDRHDDDEYALDERSDGVGYWGHHGEEDERDDVLSEVEDAVKHELECQAAVVEGVVFVG